MVDNKMKIFISYSHKDEELKDQVISHLNAINLPIEPWVDKSEIDAGDEWEMEIKNAIEQSEMAILLISTEFLNSNFIIEKELPWVITKQSLYNYRVIPFILKPSAWDEHEFYKKLEVRPKEKSLIKYSEGNGDRDEVLVDFAKEIKELLRKVEEPIAVDESKLFYKTFAILRVLELYNKDEEYSFKLTSNLSIYKKGQEYPIEIWKFVDEIESIEEYAKKFKSYFNIYEVNTTIGIVHNKTINQELYSLIYFLEILKQIRYKNEDIKKEFLKLFDNQIPINKFLSKFFNKKLFEININSNINKIGTILNTNENNDKELSLFCCSNFTILNFSENELREKLFDIVSKKFKIKLTDDGTNIFAIKPFLNVFNKALEFINMNEGNYIEFHSLLPHIDILDLPFKNINSLEFIKENIDLVEKNISDSIDINIDKLYVRLKAKFYYKGKSSKYENVDNLSNWLEEQIDSKDFTILLGDFGHGKSTFFKHMTVELSKKYLAQKEKSNFIPVYISLRQHFTKDANLKDAVTNAVMPRAKMTDEFWESNNWLIFCDGFDELSIYHQDQPNWITKVFSILYTQSEEKNVKIVLSSRPVLFLDPNIKKETLSQFNRLVLKPFDEPQITKWLENWSKYNKPISIEDIKERNLMEVLQTPVILFLIASMFHEELNDKTIKYTKSQIYKKFFDWTAKSGGFIQDGENVKHRVPENYREILQEIACEIFSHPDAKSGMLHYEVLLKQLSKKFEKDALEESLSEKIFVAHAFKESVPEHIEFIHQSLREYLVAEKIFEVYYRFCTKNFEDEPVYQFEYDELLLTKPITQTKLEFFRDIIESADDKNIKKIKKLEFFYFDLISINEYFINKKSDEMFKVYNFFDKEIIENNQHGIFNSIVGNIILLDFLFKTYVNKEVDYDELKKITTFFESNNEYSIFLQLLQKSLIEVHHYEKGIHNIKFDSFMLKKNQYYGVDFENCSFINTSFEDSIFVESGSPIYIGDGITDKSSIPTPTEFKKCVFKNVELFNTEFRTTIFSDCTFYEYQGYDEFRQFQDVEYNDCQFFNSNIHYEFFKGVVFANCIFINTKFIDMQDESGVHIEFINCITKDSKGKWIEVDQNIWNKE